MGKPYAIAAIMTMLIGSGYILCTSGLLPASVQAMLPLI
jgi:hypothetical protein